MAAWTKQSYPTMAVYGRECVNTNEICKCCKIHSLTCHHSLGLNWSVSDFMRWLILLIKYIHKLKSTLPRYKSYETFFTLTNLKWTLPDKLWCENTKFPPNHTLRSLNWNVAEPTTLCKAFFLLCTSYKLLGCWIHSCTASLTLRHRHKHWSSKYVSV